ncbi:MAG: tripartite tricarboxylate transporter TctB family protein, partial [Rubrivivax sp.]|nr:tripartite tricarboxylate transporter TctB family protein [Rubrivivax sp.]
WRALACVAAGIVANATLIERIGFVLACALCFALAVRGLRSGEGRPAGGLRQTVIDIVTGMLIAAPVFWMFTKVLAVNLPGLTASGWI